jgi:copper oxidase (laccase) domain-containing protein
MWDPEYPDNPRVDLKQINRIQLQQAGVQNVDILPHCTKCLEEDLFSHRRGEEGRNSAYLILR